MSTNQTKINTHGSEINQKGQKRKLRELEGKGYTHHQSS